MFGKNPIAPDLRSLDGSKLEVVNGSPFYTIQGEGPHAGRPAVFLRLHGCNLRCTFCDTEFSNPDDRTRTVEDLVKEITKFPPGLCVITGGEPMRQNIQPICLQLYLSGWEVQIETAGTLEIHNLAHYVEFVVSPKTPLINEYIWSHARAFKYIIDHRQQFDDYVPITATQPGGRPVPLAGPRSGAEVYLSPMDTGNEEDNAKNRLLVAQLAMKYGVRAGLQMHKFFAVD